MTHPSPERVAVFLTALARLDALRRERIRIRAEQQQATPTVQRGKVA